MADLEQIISDSIEDARNDSDPVETVDTEPTEALEATPEVPESTTEEPVEGESQTSEVASPAAKVESTETKPVVDEFAKKHGLQEPQAGQRENRLPYSRVKKIVENAEAKAIAPLQAKVSEYENKVKTYEAKLADYEPRLESVGKFEHIMLNDHEGFLRLLVQKVPGYKELFEQLSGTSTAAEQKPAVNDDPMPEPNAKLPDGSTVYDMDGLKALNEWNRRQAKREAMDEVDKKYGTFIQKQQEEAQTRERYEAMIPVINQQIETARTWPHFKDNEDTITEVLAKNPTMSLEGAYAQVLSSKVLPTLQTNKETMEKDIRERTRKEVMAEMKKAPTTSVPTSGVKPRPAQVGGSRNLEDVIREQVEASGLSR